MTGRAPALLNKTSDVLNPVLGIPPNWWVPPHKSMQNRNGQWRERRNEALSVRRRDKSVRLPSHSAWICCVPSFSQQGMVQHAFHAPSTWQVFAEGDPVSLHHQLDMDADKLLDPIALATIEGACIVSPSLICHARH